MTIKNATQVCNGLLLALALLLFMPSVNGQLSVKPDAWREITALQDVHIGSELATRYWTATGNLLGRHDRYSMSSFRANALGIPGALWWDWPGDQFGRWLSMLHVAEGLGSTVAKINRQQVLQTILPLQQKAGSFSTDPPASTDSRVVSGNAFALRGLMDAYEDTKDDSVLAAAKRMVGFFKNNFDYYSARGYQGAMHEFYGHCIDGLVKLYRLGGDKAALELAEQIADKAGLTRHTHHSLSLYRGMIDLYLVTGKTSYLERTAAYLSYIKENRIVTGGTPESLPSSEQDEGCALSDYLVVNLMMYAVTGSDKYIEEAELTMVNHFFMNQFSTGGFGHRSYGQEVVGAKIWQGWDGQYGSENPGCCSIWGQWALGQVGQYAVTRHKNAIEINFYPDGEIDLPADGVTISVKSDFPQQNNVTIQLFSKKPADREFRLRIPDWSEEVTATVNGEKIKTDPLNGRLVIRRVWNPGDRINLQFKNSYRLVRQEATPSHAAIFKGPQCLGLFSSTANIDNIVAVGVDPTGRLILGPDKYPLILENGKPSGKRLNPIADDWQSSDIKDPHRIRVMFPLQTYIMKKEK